MNFSSSLAKSNPKPSPRTASTPTQSWKELMEQPQWFLATLTAIAPQLVQATNRSLVPLQTQVSLSLLCVTAPAKATAWQCSNLPAPSSYSCHNTKEILYFTMCLEGVPHTRTTALPEERCKWLENMAEPQFSSKSLTAKCHTVDFLLSCIRKVNSLGFVFQQ